ncbi:MAG TPA: MarR family transcriptional regulator [Anaerolineales bacterium]|nr:MarR family transcriptional regulator [Anaerolineales bacterium]
MEKLDECARQLLDTAPQIMRSIRGQMRSHRGHDLSIPQFRTLTFIHRNPEVSLSHLAEHLGLTLPSTSKLVDGLVNQKIIARRESKEDRRRLTLALTRSGEEILRLAREGTQDYLKEVLGGLSADEVSTILRALDLLQPLFTKGMKEAK